jgi:N-acetylmuramoyl-L-alanine amidase
LVRILFATLALLFGAESALAVAAELESVRIKALPDRTRVVLDLNRPVGHRVFSLKGPERTVIDLEQIRLGVDQSAPPGEGLVAKIRTGQRGASGLRVVLDLVSASHAKFFALEPSGDRGHRLVVDLYAGKGAAIGQSDSQSTPVLTAGVARKAEVVVAIDAGHGGRDPGAIGPTGTLEKEVTLAVARRLQTRINAEPQMRVVMTRLSDRYLGLRDRLLAARNHGADLFVSLHADSYRRTTAQGSSVYILSQRGASSEAARWLAAQHNAADLVGGATLEGVDRDVRGVVLNMLQEHSLGDGWRLAKEILVSLKRIGPVHKPEVERAGFVVLKSPDIPSVLVEMAFLSNPAEERKLNDRRHQEKLAEAIAAGIRSYAKTRMPHLFPAPPRFHVVRRGETLGGIAERYRVSTHSLRLANGIAGDLLYIGVKLTIPSDG